MAIFGDNTAEASENNDNANYCLVCYFTLADSGAVASKLTAYIRNTGDACNAKGVIYADSGTTYPGALSGVSDGVAIGAGQTVGWVDFPFSTQPTLAAGIYHIGLIIDAGGSGFSMYYKAGSSAQTHAAGLQTYASPSDPYPAAISPQDQHYSFYVTYSTASFTGMTVTKLLQG